MEERKKGEGREGERVEERERTCAQTHIHGPTSNLEHRCDIKVTRVLFLDSSYSSVPGLYP